MFFFQFKFPARRHVFFMVIYDVIALSQILKRSPQGTISQYNRKRLRQICIRSMYVYLNPRDADCSCRIGNARQRNDVIISHQTLRKQTWRRAGNLKIKKSRIKPSRTQTGSRNVGYKLPKQLKSIVKYTLELKLFFSRGSL